MELHSESGAELRIEIVYRDDPGAIVEVVCFDQKGRQLDAPIYIGALGIGVSSLDPTKFQLYEAKSGDLVGLYREVEPELLLMVADFASGWALGALDEEIYRDPVRGVRALKELSKVAGRRLRFAEYPVVDWERDAGPK